jgi:hypothetical protein
MSVLQARTPGKVHDRGASHCPYGIVATGEVGLHQGGSRGKKEEKSEKFGVSLK